MEAGRSQASGKKIRPLECPQTNLPPSAGDSIEIEAAGVFGNVLGLGPGVLATVQWAKRIDTTVAFAVAVGFEEWARNRQPAASPAVDALPFASRRNRQQRGKGPLDLRHPGVSFRIGHQGFPGRIYFGSMAPLYPLRGGRVNGESPAAIVRRRSAG